MSNNKCKHCRIASLCIPAKLDKKTLKQLDHLEFKSRLLKPGEHLCHQGEHTDKLYAINSGLLKSYTTKKDGQEYVMGFHLPPDLFGWEGIDDKQLTVSVVAIEHSNICEIPIGRITDYIKEIPGLEKQLFHLVSRRIHKDNQALLRTSAEQRVSNFLLQLTANYTQLGFPYYMCKILMTHQDIANYLRIAPETISRIFKSLQNRGLIQVTRKAIYLTDLDTLKQIAQYDGEFVC